MQLFYGDKTTFENTTNYDEYQCLDIVLKCPSGENHYSSMALTRDSNNYIEGLLVNIKKRLSFNNMIPFYADWMGTFLARAEKKINVQKKYIQ